MSNVNNCFALDFITIKLNKIECLIFTIKKYATPLNAFKKVTYCKNNCLGITSLTDWYIWQDIQFYKVPPCTLITVVCSKQTPVTVPGYIIETSCESYKLKYWFTLCP